MSDQTLEEQQNQIKMKKVIDNAVVLSNIVELSVSVVAGLAGKDMADAINNQPVTRSVLGNLVGQRVREKLLAGN